MHRQTDLPLDGVSLAPALRGEEPVPDRTLAVHSQRVEVPEKWRNACVMRGDWRLVGPDELYDLAADPAQERNVVADHPAVADELRAFYEAWWASLEPSFDDPFGEDVVRIDLGREPVTLTAHDWHEPVGGQVPWNQDRIAEDPAVTGWWAVNVTEPGLYEFTLRSRPTETREVLPRMVSGGISLAGPGIGESAMLTTSGFGLDPKTGKPTIAPPFPDPVPAFGTATVTSNGTGEFRFVISREVTAAGPHRLEARFTFEDPPVRGAYFVTAERVADHHVPR